MAVRYVTNDGDDAAAGLDEAAPKLTIQSAVTASARGDVVMVRSGTYDERVDYATHNLRLVGYGPSRPVMDSNYTKTDAIHSTGRDSTIENFEIRRYSKNGIYIAGAKGVDNNSRVLGNQIHHINGTEKYQHGILISYGNPLIRGNQIHHVGPGSEARGIMTQYCHDHLVDGNVIYAVRKDGHRDYYGRDGRSVNNRVFACWSGIHAGTTCDIEVANNLVYDCCQGINPKHTNNEAMAYWARDPATARWSRFRHNTVLRCSWGCLVIGPNAPTTKQVDIQNNILGGVGAAGFWDAPAGRDSQIVVDHNLYVGGADWIYHRGYDWKLNGKASVSQMFTDLGFEEHGREGAPAFTDPAHHDYDCSEEGGELDSAWGTQMGARGLGPSPVPWTRYDLKAVSSDEPDPTRNSLRWRACDKQIFRYFYSTVPSNVSIVFDLGVPRPIGHIIDERMTHGGKYNVKGYRFEAGDGPEGPWTLLAEGQNPDAQGASPWYEFAPAPTARYLKWTGLSSFYPEGTGTIVLNDLMVGDLSYAVPEADTPYSQADLDQARSDGHSAGFVEGRADGYDEGHRQGRADMLSDARAALDAIPVFVDW